MKCATVAIVGRPSSGKSTLINTICENKVSIVATTPQTTRNAIRGVYTDQRGQLILIDTPGYHLSDQIMNQRLLETTLLSLGESEIVLYLIDATREPGEEERTLAKLLSKSKVPLVVAINKGDVTTKKENALITSFLSEHLPKLTPLIISAKEDQGVDELLIELFKHAPEGPLLYSEETFTDQPLEFRIAEIIREKAISSLIEELPHSLFVEVADIEYHQEDQTVWIRAFINVERESQKGIVIGSKGEGIKRIRQASFKEIRRIFPQRKLHLDLRVKTLTRWRKNLSVLDTLL